MVFFNIPFCFNKQEVLTKILTYNNFTNNSSYICVVDANTLSFVNKSTIGKIVVNNSLVNICDSSYIPLLIRIIHGLNFKHYTGCDLFFELLKQKGYDFFFLGTNNLVLRGLKENLSINYNVSNYYFKELPYLSVEHFDYAKIARNINLLQSKKIIFVSLGAPKQEIFMYKLSPLLQNSILIGVGAVFNYYSNSSGINRAPRYIQKIRLEWLYRYIYEPRKQLLRDMALVKNLPRILFDELKIKWK